MLIAIIAAVIAGACFAFAGVLQQRAASLQPAGESLSPKLLASLAREPIWLGGIGLAVLSYVFQGVALSFGPLSVVQPLIVSELVFALPVSARIHGIRMGPRDWGAALMVVVGLAIAIVAASPSEGESIAPLSGWLVVFVVDAVLVAFALGLGRHLGGTWRASSFALAGGVTMGTQSAVFDSTLTLLGQDGFGAFASWEPYVLIVMSIGGLLLIQSAYQAGPLAASAPVIDATEPITSVAIGVFLFNEAIASGTLRYAGIGVGVIAVLAGIVLLDTSPVIHKLRREEDKEGQEHQEPEHSQA